MPQDVLHLFPAMVVGTKLGLQLVHNGLGWGGRLVSAEHVGRYGGRRNEIREVAINSTPITLQTVFLSIPADIR